MSDAPKMVKVTMVGDRVHEFSLADGETVNDMLGKAGLSASQGTVKVTGTPLAELDRPLRDGDIITVTPTDIKGGLRK